MGYGRRLAGEGIACLRPPKVRPEEHIFDTGNVNIPELRSDNPVDSYNNTVVDRVINDTKIPKIIWKAMTFALQESYKPDTFRTNTFDAGNGILFSYHYDASTPYLAMYVNDLMRSVIFAIPGTNIASLSLSKNIFQDLASDVNIFLGGGPSSEADYIRKDMMHLFEQYRGWNKYVAGHSLGGAIVQYLSKSDLASFPFSHFIGFNSGSSPLQYFNKMTNPTNKFINLVITGDLISMSNKDIDYKFMPEIETNSHSMAQFVYIFSR